jgi:hypothetical protein
MLPVSPEPERGVSAETPRASDLSAQPRQVPSLLPPPPAPGTSRAGRPPSWPRVLATTLRLWAQRRLRSKRPRKGTLIVLALVAAVLAAGASAVAITRNAPAANAPAGHGQPGNGALGAAAAVRGQAADWTATQVAADAIIACDPAMCAVLQSRGIPASRLLVLAPGNADPLGSDVVMATAAVRSQFGSRLTSVYAPVVLSSFGSGSAQIAVRVTAPDGAAAYLAALRADQRARAAAGRQLLHNPRLRAAPAARREIPRARSTPAC